VPYAGKDIPAGWLACDNASYPTTTYPLLFSKIGYTYGTDDTKYRVPDTRGVFMRGMDATATRDANRPAGSIQLSGTVPDTNSVFTGASASATGGVGYVPAPLAGQQNYALTGDGKWTGPQYYYSIAAPQRTDTDPHIIKWPLTGNVFSKTTTAITHTVETTFALAPGYAYKITAGIGANSINTNGGCTMYILANGVQIGNVGAMISTNNPDTWGTSPTCMAYHEPVVQTDISFVIGLNQGAIIGGWTSARGGAWISIEMLH
jgi:microcystin-dependent protein